MSTNKHTKSSGNVFRDLGLDHPDERYAKAELARQIATQIQAQGLTQVQAAKVLDIDQPKVSALIRGNLSGFSIERLLRFALSLGFDVDLLLRRARSSAGAVRVSTR